MHRMCTTVLMRLFMVWSLTLYLMSKAQSWFVICHQISCRGLWMFPRYNTVKEGGKDGRSWTWVRWELLVPSSSTAFFFFFFFPFCFSSSRWIVWCLLWNTRLVEDSFVYVFLEDFACSSVKWGQVPWKSFVAIKHLVNYWKTCWSVWMKMYIG